MKTAIARFSIGKDRLQKIWDQDKARSDSPDTIEISGTADDSEAYGGVQQIMFLIGAAADHGEDALTSFAFHRKEPILDLLKSLREADPSKKWAWDEVEDVGAEVVGFVHEDMFIYDPFHSSCGRFEADPEKDYGLSKKAAEILAAENERRSAKG